MRHRLIGLFTAALLAIAGMTAVLATQTAEASDPPRYGDAIMPSGFQPIPVQWMYLQFWESRFPDRPVVKIDTEHATADGFYFAIRAGSPGTRNIQWVTVKYGFGCDFENARNLVFNPWMNTYWCAEDPSFFEALDPGYNQRTDSCRSEFGQPWKSVQVDGSNECWNRELFRHTTSALSFQHNMQSAHLAPWESQEALNDTSWNSLPALDIWVPAPDTCTGLPLDGNSLDAKNAVEPTPNTNVPNCLGQDLAPNCTAATASDPACGGPIWPNTSASPTPTATVTPTVAPTATPTQPTASPSPPGSVTSTQSVTDFFSVTGVASRTEQATVRVKRRTVRVSVTRTINGRQVTRTGAADIVVKRSAQATAEAMLTEEFSSTGSGTCTLPTQQEADNCALAAARENAAAIAADTYTGEMNTRAATKASTDALAEARRRATAAAENTTITKKMVRKAKREARLRAAAQF